MGTCDGTDQRGPSGITLLGVHDGPSRRAVALTLSQLTCWLVAAACWAKRDHLSTKPVVAQGLGHNFLNGARLIRTYFPITVCQTRSGFSWPRRPVATNR